MPVTDILMKSGSWQLKFKPDTPKSIRDACGYFGHVFIVSDWVDVRKLSDSGVQGIARYAGIVRKKPDAYSIGGPGVTAWLGDEDGKGNVYETAKSLTAGSFSSWVTTLLPSSLTAGTITAIAGSLTESFNYVTPRTALDYVMAFFAGEYRVNPNGTLDAGPASSLFVTTPKAVVMRRSNGRDMAVVGLLATKLDHIDDADEYTTRVLVLASGNGGHVVVGSANGAATTYKDLKGNAVVFTRVVNSPSTKSGNENTLATNALNNIVNLRQQVVLDTDSYDIGRDVKVGDYIYVFDPERGIYDTSQQVRYRGSLITPAVLRVYEYTWPVERGMGVFYRDVNGAYTDLSNYILFDTGTVSYKVGAPMRLLAGQGQPVSMPATMSASLARQSAPAVTSGQAAASSALTLTVTPTDIPGATLTFTTYHPNATILITGVFDFIVTGADGTLVGVVDLDGANAAAGNAQATFGGASGSTGTTVQSAVATIATPGSHTVKLQAYKTSGAGTSSASNPHSTISYVLID